MITFHSDSGGKYIAKFTRINERITAPNLRVIGPDGSALGVLTREEALLAAQTAGLDLIEVAPQAQPPVAKILDFQKFRYTESKKERAAKKNATAVELKEIWFSPRIAEHDINVRLKKAEEFLAKGNRVKFTVRFRGREMSHPQLGHNVIDQILKYFGDRISIEREPRFEGRNLSFIAGLARGKSTESQNLQKSENQGNIPQSLS